EVPKLNLTSYVNISVFSTAAALLCTVGASLWACFSALSSVPAALMRPKAPKAGKRVLLERITPLWKRMGFFSKLTTRNLLRYQKRFWMTILGIGGCTALIIAGFGLRSSLTVTMDRQYGELFKYEAQLTIDSDIEEEDRLAIEEFIAGRPEVDSFMACRMASVSCETESYTVSGYLEVCDPEKLPAYVDVHDFYTKEPISLDDSGVIIGTKLSEMLQVSIGDTFTVDDGDRHELRVSGINEHYLAHYMYISPAYYEEVFGKAPEINAYQLDMNDGSKDTCSKLFSDFMDLKGASAASRMENIRDTYQHSMERIDFVVVIVILSAAALAMVVLYDLSTINITERRRELATIQVLGFYDGEVAAYIYRENIVLTLLGIALGIVLGRILHAWLVKSVEIELMMFGRDTDPKAFLWAALLTALFSLIVNLISSRSLKQIDMVESLKSAE
ncbi:MAG: ABC transporter permease, partial [Firmicutes bacterium]|nr:ABC transporter permease [Bacillota bacterium]